MKYGVEIENEFNLEKCPIQKRKSMRASRELALTAAYRDTESLNVASQAEELTKVDMEMGTEKNKENAKEIRQRF